MNAVEIEAAVSDLALSPFDAAEFAFAFLAAFGHKETTIKRLRSGNNNASEIDGGILLRNHIHILVCQAGHVGTSLATLRASLATSKAKTKFILATDGQTLEAEELATGETIACAYPDFPNHFGFFLQLAGISTIKEIKDNPIDVRATGRLNKLYIELLNENPDWARDERRADMNHFMARLIFCFFAEDTDIFNGEGLFTQTVEQMSERDGSNTHLVLSAIFRAMNIKIADRATAEPRLPAWADGFPYVNGGLFSGSTEVPRFTRIARTYLIHAGNLNWQQINPDIFGSMIQAVADDAERGALGMHYTSVPNILKVLNPLFLDDLRTQLQEAGENKAKLLNLRKRLAHIRVFDPACGSGNFLVIAYKQMREIEAEINRRRNETYLGSAIPLTNFRGIELCDFPAEIARLALIIAEFQCDVLYRGQKDALAEFLPLDTQNWIICGNALRLDWLKICPPTGTRVKLVADDLFGTPLDQVEMDFENEGGETYICGNPPYKGSQTQDKAQKADLAAIFTPHNVSHGQIDYVGGWFMKAAVYAQQTKADAAFVSTNSICQGRIVPLLWPKIFELGSIIRFAHTSFKWANLASHNAGVTVAIVGLSTQVDKNRYLFDLNMDGETVVRAAANITPYLTIGANTIVRSQSTSITGLSQMSFGNMPVDGGNLLLSENEVAALDLSQNAKANLVRRILGSDTFPVPLLTEQNKADLTVCAENILLAREAHFPATIADLYDPANMPENLRAAHERNDEVLERIYIGRRFKNDTERLEKLFELYTKMTAASTPSKTKPASKRKGAI